MQKRVFYLVTVVLITASCILSEKKNNGADQYVAITPIAVHHNGTQFIDSEVCKECHQQIVQDHYKTTHFNSFQPANKHTIKGSFKKGRNTLHLNKNITFNFTEKDSGFYQEPIINNQSTPFYSAKIDIVVGSGTKGQSYLMWNTNQLFQLQASYFTPTDDWINSPGAPDQLTPARPVIERCLECHTTYAQNISKNKNGNQFHRKNLVYGIDCQRCHGPVVDHIKYHKLNPEDRTAKHIIKYSSLSRQQRLDACALCHSGLRVDTTERAFSFEVGDILKKFSLPDYNEDSLSDLDVHGNQYGLLTASKCFQKSNTLNCTSCHNPHKKERGNIASFNQKCLSCHNPTKNIISCGENQSKVNKMGNDCVHCHMPLVNSKTMKIQTPNKDEMSVKIRTHLIRVYIGEKLK